ncbi:MAG: type VI secretion system tip protein TssI/VgrG [Byssovorax sp.]
MAREKSQMYEVFFTTEGLEPGDARVRRVAGHEGLSTSYAFDVELEIPGGAFDPVTWLMAPAAVLMVRTGDGTLLRRIAGYVGRVAERASRGPKQRIALTLDSPLARLRLLTDHRIFQEMTTKDIVAAILGEAGLDASLIEWRLQGSYPTREVCTQLGETSFDFVSRLLEEDGIFYFFEHSEEGSKIVFGDSSSAYAPTTPTDEISFKSASGLVADEAIAELGERERVRPAKVTLRDHDFKKPKLDLEKSAETDAPLGRELYDYPGRYVDPDEGARRAKLRLEALTAEAVTLRGSGSAGSLTPGHTFKLSGALDPALDREYVVLCLDAGWDDTKGEGPVCTSRFELLPKEVPYRPMARTPRAVVPGPQLATVTGPAGEEIHTDEYGRIKVSFPWDRRSTKDDKSSCWVRVGQLHSSGAVIIPRIGWEVIVDFEDGDPDRPIVLGRAYNGVYGPPYALPGNKTRSSLQSASSPGGGGHNEVRMEDGAGGEHVHLHAEKDMNVVVANNKTEKVGTASSYGVGADETIKVGANETLKVGAGHEITVGTSQSHTVGASRSKSVSGNENATIGGSRTWTIGGSHMTTSSRSVETSTPAGLTETVGGSCMEVAALGVTMAVAGTASVSVGGAKVEAVVTGKSDFTIGAQATTVGGAFISAAASDVGFNVKGAKATTVGGVWTASAGGDIELSSDAAVNINVGGAVALNAAEIVLKVGGSCVTIATGSVVIKTTDLKLTATGPQPELSAGVEDA